MALQCGIVGLPNVGKSTLFSALTHSQVHIDTYPFTTVDPHVGVVPVPDERLTKLAEILHSEKVIPTTLRVVDIAGLIRGSHLGEGLGNQFLAQIREVDAIIHLVRCFTNDQVSHIDETLNPVRDIDIIETEIILKDLETVTSRQNKLVKKAKTGDKDAGKKMEVLDKIASFLNQGIAIRKTRLDEEEKDVIKDLFLISAKPVLYVGNVNEDEATSHLPGSEAESLQKWGEENEERVLILSAALEVELAFLEDEEERQFFMDEWDLKTTSLEVLTCESYALLDLVTFFTTESNYAQAWTVERGCSTPRAASVIHSDFEKGFIKAEVYSYEDLFTYGSEAELRKHGLIHIHGRDYIIQDGDVVKIKFSP